MEDRRATRVLDAVLSVTSDLDLQTVLERIVEAACELIGARYGALGVIAEDGDGLARFVHTGLDEAAVARIGHLPEGRGVLGAIVDHPVPLRLTELADDPRSVGFPPDHPPMHSFLGAPIRVRDWVYGNLYLTEKRAGDVFTSEDEELVVAFAAVAGAAIANARLLEDSQRRDRWQAAVLDLAVAVLSGLDDRDATDRVAELARSLVDAGGAAVVAHDRAGTRVLATAGDAPPLGLTPPGTPVEQVLDRGERLRLDRSPLFGDRAVVWVPLVERHEVVAALGVARGHAFGDVEVDLIESFAAQASLVLAHQRASDDVRRLELIEDRERIGRDLHDTVIQRLFATGLTLEAVTRMSEDRPEVAARLARAVDDVNDTIQRIRTTIFALQAPSEARSVRTELLAVADEVGRLLLRPPSVRFHGPIDTLVDDELASQVVPVVREALTNAAKHARAEHVGLDVTTDSDHLEVRIVDDGVGTVEAAPGGFGLTNLRERARARGGVCTVGAGPDGTGTLLVWRVPLVPSPG